MRSLASGGCGMPQNRVQPELRAMEVARKLAQPGGELLGRRGTQRDMPQLAASARSFAVKVQMRVTHGKDLCWVGHFSDQIEHSRAAQRARRAQWQADHGAQVIFELAGERAFDSPMPRIVDARRHFVSQQAPFVLEKFDGQHANILQRIANAASRVLSGMLERPIQLRRRRQGQAQNSAPMVILHQRIHRGFAGAPANSQNAQLASERDQPLEQERCTLVGTFCSAVLPRGAISCRQFIFRCQHIFRLAQNPLTLAVVTHAAGFQNRGQANSIDGAIERIAVRDRGKFSGGDTQLLKQMFFGETVLRRLKRGRRRKHRYQLSKKAGRFHRHILKFVGNQLQSSRKFLQRRAVGVLGSDARRDAPHRSFWRGIEKAKVKTQRISRERKHVSELTAAEDTDGHARFPFFALTGWLAIPSARDAIPGSGFARTRSVCALRNFRYASRTSGCFAPRMAAASRAALIAPALPMASVPTGMPPGIWAMESSESSPLSALDSTGTPSTGSTVFDAVMPGRCAAPLDPALITSMPRLSAEEAYSNKRSGVRCADTTRVSCGTPSSSRVFAACSSVSQSEDEPMMMPTNGSFAEIESFAILAFTEEADILRCFSARRDLRALFPILAKLPDQI